MSAISYVLLKTVLFQTENRENIFQRVYDYIFFVTTVIQLIDYQKFLFIYYNL